MKDSLREAGLSITSAVFKSGADARRHISDRDQDSIVMLNIHTQNSDAMEFLDWVREQTFYKELLVVVVGDRSRLRGVVEACERGAHTFLIRPIHVEDLKNLAARYPDHWRASGTAAGSPHKAYPGSPAS